MKTTIAIIVILVLVIGGYFLLKDPKVDVALEEASVRATVTAFGAKLKNVSVLSPTAPDDIRREYAGLVAPVTIGEWAASPENAPGRETSSPYPDRIEIELVTKTASNDYMVTGDIVEATNADAGAQTFRRPVTMYLGEISADWLITSVSIGNRETGSSDDISTAGWKTYSGAGFSFQYPDPFPAKYISLTTTGSDEPKVTVTTGALSCTGGSTQRTIDGKIYCVSETTEGAAGSIYHTYTYATVSGAQMLRGTFTLRFVQCANYPEPQKTECETERTTFNIDSYVDRIADSVRVGT